GMGVGRWAGWRAGDVTPPPAVLPGRSVPASYGTGSAAVALRPDFQRALDRARSRGELDEDGIVTLLAARGPEIEALAGAADDLRREICGGTVTFVVNCNINYTNMCCLRRGFCAFSQGPNSLNRRGVPYLLSRED